MVFDSGGAGSEDAGHCVPASRGLHSCREGAADCVIGQSEPGMALQAATCTVSDEAGVLGCQVPLIDVGSAGAHDLPFQDCCHACRERPRESGQSRGRFRIHSDNTRPLLDHKLQKLSP